MIKLGKKFKNFSLFVFICELFFIGRLKFAPGTIASILTVLIGYYLLKNLNLIEFFMIIIIVNFIGYISIDIYLKRVHENDPKEIVIDEVSGQLISLLPIVLLGIEINFQSLFYSFITFRFFDITKIGLNKIEKLQGALGVLLDDIVAGIYSIIIQFLFWYLIS